MENCPFCTAPVRPQARFCIACGKKLVGDEKIPLSADDVSSVKAQDMPAPSGNAPPPTPVVTSQPEQEPQEKAIVVVSEVEPEGAAPSGMNAPVMERERNEDGESAERGEGDEGGGLVERGRSEASSEDGESGESNEYSPAEHIPLMVGKKGVMGHSDAIARKLLGLVPFAKAENRERNRALFERHSQQSVSMSEPSWGQVAYIAGVYGHLMGGLLPDTQHRLELWQALLWAIQYEYFFRSSQFDERFLRLAEFLHSCVRDEAFQTEAIKSLEIVLFEFDTVHLKSARQDLEKLPASPVLLTLKQMMERYAALAEYRPVLDAIEHLWRFLDSKKEEPNRANLLEFRLYGPTQPLLLRLVTMAVFICRNALALYARGMPENGGRLSDEDLQDAIVLTNFACRCATGVYAVEAQKYASLLRVLQEVNAGRTSPDVFRKLMDAPALAPVPASSNGSGDAGSVPGNQTVSAQNTQTVQGTLAQGVQSADAEPGPVPGQERKSNKRENSRETLADIFGEEQLARLLDGMRTLRLEQIYTTLNRARKPLLLALRNQLADASFDELLPPRRTFYVRGNIQDDAFPTLKRSLLGSDKAAQRRSLALLERAARDAVDRETIAIAREWMLFARACILGLDKALPAWRDDYTRGLASPEEIWNLAIASMRGGDSVQALEILKPGILEKTAPFSHLRFALKCSVDILQQADNVNKAPGSRVMAFMLDHLTRLPLPECYLIWLLLAHDAQETFNADRQSQVISTLLDILDRPIQMLSVNRRAGEITVKEFENEFNGLLSVIRHLEEMYTFEEQDGRIAIRSKMLETFLHMPQIILRRVGLFVDYENLSPLLPWDLQARPKEVGNILTRHAAKYGEVVCGWLCAAPGNIPNPDAIFEGFQDAGFKIKYPRGRTGQLHPTESLADFVLVESIIFEMSHSKPDVYIIVSGDGDYFERIMGLLEQGNTVYLVAGERNMANRYSRLAQRSKQGRLPEGYGDFFIDRLEEIFPSRSDSPLMENF